MNRRKLLAVTIGAGAAVAAVGVVGISQAATDDSSEASPAADESIQEPAGGAGLYEDDPDQANLSQDPNVAVTGDIEALPEDVEF